MTTLCPSFVAFFSNLLFVWGREYQPQSGLPEATPLLESLHVTDANPVPCHKLSLGLELSYGPTLAINCPIPPVMFQEDTIINLYRIASYLR